MFSETNLVSANKTTVYEDMNRAEGILFQENFYMPQNIHLFNIIIILSSTYVAFFPWYIVVCQLLFLNCRKAVSQPTLLFSQELGQNIELKKEKSCRDEVLIFSFYPRIEYCFLFLTIEQWYTADADEDYQKMRINHSGKCIQ